ncbi:hypothetical protein [Paenibacillus dendritiformis]|uniref:hypothetical protein n=1 Tax=Paenibacillus dendritiformis TaxID=130049 RepID=UPI001FF0AE07|nr:hypothetical protein [Paenibacillus dendritiformis]
MNSSAAGATEIAVDAAVAGVDIIIEVRDNGGGIRESEVPFLPRQQPAQEKARPRAGLAPQPAAGTRQWRGSRPPCHLGGRRRAPAVPAQAARAIAARGCPCAGRTLPARTVAAQDRPASGAACTSRQSCRALRTGRACSGGTPRASGIKAGRDAWPLAPDSAGA